MNRKLSAVGSFYTHASRDGVDVGDLLMSWQVGGSRSGWKPFLHHVSKTNPHRRRTVSLKAAKKLPRVLTPEQVQALLDGCDHLRDRLLLAVLYDTGMRIGEALGLRHNDISVSEREVTVTRRDNDNGARAKSITSRTVPVSARMSRSPWNFGSGPCENQAALTRSVCTTIASRSSAARSAGRCRCPLTRRNFVPASTNPAAHHRNAIRESRHRLTLRE